MGFVWRTVLLALLGACSFALSGPQPNRPRGVVPQCDTGKGLVVLDGLDAAALGVAGLALAGSNNGSAAVLPIALAAAFVGAAAHGSHVVDECRDAMDAYANETRPVEPIAHEAPPEEPEPPAAPPPVVIKPKPQPVAAPKPAPAAAAPWPDFWQEVR